MTSSPPTQAREWSVDTPQAPGVITHLVPGLVVASWAAIPFGPTASGPPEPNPRPSGAYHVGNATAGPSDESRLRNALSAFLIASGSESAAPFASDAAGAAIVARTGTWVMANALRSARSSSKCQAAR